MLTGKIRNGEVELNLRFPGKKPPAERGEIIRTVNKFSNIRGKGLV
jgi:hypothetical protein